jgi:TctA family transporter
MFAFILIIQLLFVFVGLSFLYTKSKEEEENLYAKLIGFMLLGAIGFWVFFIPVPIGYMMELLFLDATENATIKKQAGLIGCILFLSISLY